MLLAWPSMVCVLWLGCGLGSFASASISVSEQSWERFMDILTKRSSVLFDGMISRFYPNRRCRHDEAHQVGGGDN